MTTAKKIFVALLLILAWGCEKPIPPQAQWQGTLGTNIPLTFQLDAAANPPRGYFINGGEQTPIPDIRLHDDSLSFVFSEYGAEMKGRWNGKEWKGNYIRYRNDTSLIAFIASPGTIVPATSNAPRILPPVGNFLVQMKRDSTVDSTTLATFWMHGDSLFGTFIAQDGDYGLNVGGQVGDQFELSRFNGWQAMRFELQYRDGAWAGKHQVRNLSPTIFTLTPRPTLPKEIPGAKFTALKDPKAPFRWSGILSSGDSLTDRSPQLKGKVVLLDIMGTWCHNCMDEAPLLEQLYREFNKEGLEVVGYSFEIRNDAALAKKNLGIYATRHGLTFPLIFGGDTDASEQEKLHSQMLNFYAHPTALFIDRKGMVREIHIGFRGIGTGDEFQQEVKQFYDTVKLLLKK